MTLVLLVWSKLIQIFENELFYSRMIIFIQTATGIQERSLTTLPHKTFTVFDATLTSKKTREKLQCLYENLMSHRFRRRAVPKKYDL